MPTYRREDGTYNDRAVSFRQRIVNSLRERLEEEIEDGATTEEVVGIVCSTVMDLTCDASIKKRLRRTA